MGYFHEDTSRSPSLSSSLSITACISISFCHGDVFPLFVDFLWPNLARILSLVINFPLMHVVWTLKCSVSAGKQQKENTRERERN